MNTVLDTSPSLMNGLLVVLKRDLRVALRRRSDTLSTLVFFVIDAPYVGCWFAGILHLYHKKAFGNAANALRFERDLNLTNAQNWQQQRSQKPLAGSFTPFHCS